MAVCAEGWLVPIDRPALSRGTAGVSLAFLLPPIINYLNPTTPQATTNTSATMSEEAENEQLTIRIKDGVSALLAGGAGAAGY